MQTGNVELDLTWYSGKDLYSDGDVEDELLKIAQDISQEQYNEVIGAKKSWPVFYHFSHLRENILTWVPFTGREKVLEIGSGCGAVTGALCRLAGEVTGIDLSLKRSRINANRNRKAGNLRLYVGNFEDIEPNLPDDYDVITLIGVFEYSAGYIHSPEPYEEFLRRIGRHLKPGGRILLAIENRFGLKYWAGCTEDHTGVLFDGLEGYPAGGGVRTFTRREMERILKHSGPWEAAWYFPFPDYKFPMAVYSERRLPEEGELNRTEYNFDRLRMELFDESKVYDSILESGLYPEFANSFFLVITREGEQGKTDYAGNPVYVKFSNDRSPQFRIRTEILEEKDGTRLVRKTAEESGIGHIALIPDQEKALKELFRAEGFLPNRLTDRQDDGICSLEYLQGSTLEEKLDRLLSEKGKEEAAAVLLNTAGKIRRICSGGLFRETEEFRKIFGSRSFARAQQSARVCDIDLVATNLIPSGSRMHVLDYEWTFFFPIPADYVVWRFLHYYIESDAKRHILDKRALCSAAGLSEQDLPVFEQMEQSFQNYILGGHIPMRMLYSRISPGKVNAARWFARACARSEQRQLQVYFDRGSGFREEDSFRYPLTAERMTIPVPAGSGNLRLDPGEAPGGFRIVSLTWDDGSPADFMTNGYPLGDQRYYFGSGDPQILLYRIPGQAASLTLVLEQMQEPFGEELFWKRFAGGESEQEEKIRRLEQELSLSREIIRQMENTKVWRLYRKLRPLRGDRPE